MGAVNSSKMVWVLLRMRVVEAQVLELVLDLVEAEAVGQRRIDVERLAGDLVLLAGEHGAEGAHVVQAVGDLDEDDTDIVAHREQELLECLGLERRSLAEDAAADLGEALHDVGHLGAEEVGDVLVGIVGVLLHVVQQGGAYGGGAEAYLLAYYLRHDDGVHDIRFTREPSHTAVGLLGKVEGLGDYLDLLAMVGGEVSVEQVPESGVDHLLVLYGIGSFVVHVADGLFDTQFLAGADARAADFVELFELGDGGMMFLSYLGEGLAALDGDAP